MKTISAAAVSLALLGGAPVLAESSTISPNGARPAARGPAQTFTGAVLVEPLFGLTEKMNATGGHVTFAPGARSAWHTHPAGQMLIVTDGTGWVQEEGGPKREIKAGDVIWCPPGVKHWHGTTATTVMRHIAITGSLKQECRLARARHRRAIRRQIGVPDGKIRNVSDPGHGRGSHHPD